MGVEEGVKQLMVQFLYTIIPNFMLQGSKVNKIISLYSHLMDTN